MTTVTGTPRLVLWDIDQTLIDGGTATHSAYAAAFHQATGAQLVQPWQFDGRTELAAAGEVLLVHGFDPAGELLRIFLDLIIIELQQRAPQLAATGKVLSGAAEALAAAGRTPGMHQSVLTGNLYPLAVLKLTTFSLDTHLDLRIGAYGGDAVERADLPRHALDRARHHLGQSFLGTQMVIIGDTRRDIQAAHAIGAKAIGVATGTTSAAELHATGADVVLPDLTDTQAVLHAITT
jgi:phosphoglycolate phosphatase-like HAD superfamily hydrolase